MIFPFKSGSAQVNGFVFRSRSSFFQSCMIDTHCADVMAMLFIRRVPAISDSGEQFSNWFPSPLGTVNSALTTGQRKRTSGLRKKCSPSWMPDHDRFWRSGVQGNR